MKLEPDVRAEFMAEASHRPASQIVRKLMRDFVQQQPERRENTAFLQGKVDEARILVSGEQGRSNGAVEAEFAARHGRITD